VGICERIGEMRRLIFIHGATASSRSFAYLKKTLKPKDAIFLDYDRETSADQNLENMYNKLEKEDGEFFYIAHSLGGIYAVYLQDVFKVASVGAVSLATPFNGSEIATWGRLIMPHYQLFMDITPTSNFISQSREINIHIPWTQVVTTIGDVPWVYGANDGIVTRRSMICRNDIDYIKVERNHYEVLQSRQVVDLIKTQTQTQEKNNDV
jgi:pimeloyl-ACP methyl ester carboxylesterase